MAGMFVKFALYLIISCALLVRFAEAVPGNEKPNNQDFHESSRGDKPFFIKEINNYLIYSISKELKSKTRFSEVEDKPVLTRVAERILEVSNITEVMITGRILHSFNKQIQRLMDTAKAAP